MFALTIACVLTQAGDRAGETQSALPDDLEVPPAPALDAAAEADTLRVPPGFEISLVAAEPLVVDPVQVVYDERGRLWVVEMRGYMPDAEGTGELEPIGRIAILTDTDGDGAMDERAEFATELVLPRGVAPIAGGAVCVLPPELVFLRDDDGDGTFDTREVIATGLRQGLANPEHAINSPTFGPDNWIHFANWNRRIKRVWDEDGTPRWLELPERGGGQWGLSIDEYGRVLRNTNPNPLYVDLVPSSYAVRNRHQRGFRGAFANVDAKHAVFPARINPGVNRGYQPNTLRDDWTLRQFTAACAPTVLVGDGLGEDARGDVFVAEPSGNLVKRYAMTEPTDAVGPTAKSVHAKTDFLTSTDERFRPVAMTTAPDGSLIIADMYRGILQHRVFMTTFLREQVDARGLATPLGQGRIWKVRKAGARERAQDVDLVALQLDELVPRLASDNAWERLSAQRILVEDFDGEANVVAALEALAARGGQGARQALWTLDGIGFSRPEVIEGALGSSDAALRADAVQVAEPLIGAEGNDLVTTLARLATGDPSARVRLLALLALGASPDGDALDALAARMTESAASALERSAVISGLEFREGEFLARLAADEGWERAAPGRPELLEALAACIGRERLAENLSMAVDLALDPPAGWWSEPLLAGLLKTRGKGPKGQLLPLRLRAEPVALTVQSQEAQSQEAQSQQTRSHEVGVVERVEEGCTWPGKPGAVLIEEPRELTAAERVSFDHGAEVYAAACATCHQDHGGGQMGKAPTLRQTEYAVGDEKRLVKILLYGLEGPLNVDGTVWNMEMPRFEGSDRDLASVLTYVRRSWGNGADPVTVETVESLRAAGGSRTRPLAPADLK